MFFRQKMKTFLFINLLYVNVITYYESNSEYETQGIGKMGGWGIRRRFVISNKRRFRDCSK